MCHHHFAMVAVQDFGLSNAMLCAGIYLVCPRDTVVASCLTFLHITHRDSHRVLTHPDLF